MNSISNALGEFLSLLSRQDEGRKIWNGMEWSHFEKTGQRNNKSGDRIGHTPILRKRDRRKGPHGFPFCYIIIIIIITITIIKYPQFGERTSRISILLYHHHPHHHNHSGAAER